MDAALRFSLDELLLSLRRKRIPIQFEVGTFVVLEACEAAIDSPVRIGCSDVSIDDEGRVLVSESAEKATAEESIRALIDVLCDLLLASAPGVPDTLLQLIEHGPSDDQYTLSRLKDELETALVPLNRSATRRVLARLVREAKQPGERQVAQPQFVKNRTELNDEFDTLFGRDKDASSGSSSAIIDSDQPPRSNWSPHDPDSNRSDQIRFEAELRQDDSYESDQKIRRDRTAIRNDLQKGDRRPTDHTDDFVDIKEQTEKKSPVIARLGFAAVALLLLAIGFFVFTGQKDDDTRTSTKLEVSLHVPNKSAANSPVKSSAPAGPARIVLPVHNEPARGQKPVLWDELAAVETKEQYLRERIQLESTSAKTALELKQAQETPPLEKASPQKSVLRVNSTPSLAQVMLFVGQGLARIERVPLGVAHEFVAIADGYSPLRIVLASDAKWHVKDGDSFTSLKMTLVPQKDKRSASDLGSTRLPRQHSAPWGQFGTVEIRTEPSEAAIYQLVGFTPDLAIEGLSSQQPIRLLIYAAGYRVEHIDMGPAQWIEREGQLSAEVEAELKPIE